MKIEQVVPASGGILEQVLAFLDKMPDDEVLTTAELEIKVKARFLENGAFKRGRWRWADYHQKIVLNGQMQYVWGSRKGIAALRAQLNLSEDTNEN